MMGEQKNIDTILVRKTPLERPRGRQEDNINIDLNQIGCKDKSGRKQLRIVNSGRISY
jgi:hypothetical protein